MNHASGCPAGAPVVDYFDHQSRAYVDERYRWYEDIRASVGPVFWTPHHGGFWVVIGFDELQSAAKDWETFSSRHVIDATGASCPVDGITYDGLFAPPRRFASRMLEEDPPEWILPRQVLAPHFSLPAVERWRPRIQELVDAFIDRRIETGSIDFATDLCNYVPAIFSLELVGVPSDHYELVAANRHTLSHVPGDHPAWEEMADDIAYERAQLIKAFEGKRDGTSPRGRDILSVLLDAKDKGVALTDEDIVKLANLVIGAGIDTTSATLCSTLAFITGRPDLREKLRAEPRLAVTAFEEFVRLATPTQGLCRTVTRDTELGGQKLRRGDRLMLCFGAACRDPKEFENADDIVIERKPVHVGFGAGNHRCIGSLFARLEFETIFNTVLRRMPDFQVDLDAVRSFDNVGVVTGFTTVPATFTPGPKVGADPKIPGWAF